AIALILSYVGLLSFGGTVTAGVVFAFLQYMERFFEPINQVSQNLNIFQQALVSASRVFALIDDGRVEPAQNENRNCAIADGRVAFTNVSFSYDGTMAVLKDFSSPGEPGNTVALVGHTGTGKSSIINLFMRFYEFVTGEILIDRQSIREL